MTNYLAFPLKFLPLFGAENALQFFVVLSADFLHARLGFLPQTLQLFTGFLNGFLNFAFLRFGQAEFVKSFLVTLFFSRLIYRAEPIIIRLERKHTDNEAERENS